jgi:T5SS/PEP-CTERM-associated repeat protein
VVIPDSLFADSNGGTPGNNVVINVGDYSLLNFGGSRGTTARFGIDGDVTLNLDGPNSSVETRQAVLAAGPGTTTTFNILGNGDPWTTQPVWHMRTWYVDVGRQGTGIVNVTGGARIVSAQRLTIGGSVFGTATAAGGTGYLTVDGPDSSISFASTSVDNAGLHIGRRGTGFATVSNGGTINVRHASDGSTGAIWVGNSIDGQGTLHIKSGGFVQTDGPFRVATTASAKDSVVTVEDAGSRLKVEGISFIGNTSTVGAGTLNVLKGAEVELGSSLRVGNFAGAVGFVNIDGARRLPFHLVGQAGPFRLAGEMLRTHRRGTLLPPYRKRSFQPSTR